MAKTTLAGDLPLADGMRISVRMRRDFTVTNAERFLAAARHAYRELHPDADAQEVDAVVTSCAADAVFVVLECAGLLGDVVDESLQRRAADELASGGWRAQVVVNEPEPLRPGPDCFRAGDVFALPDVGD